MANEKRLIIGTQFSDKGLKEAERALKRLEKEGLKISSVLKDFDLTTGAGRGRFAKSIVQANQQMLKLKGTTQDTAKVMQNVYGRQLEQESKRLDRVTKQLDTLNKKRKEAIDFLEKANRLNPNGRTAAIAGKEVRDIENLIVNKEAERRVRSANLDNLKKGDVQQKIDGQIMAATIARAVAGAISQGAGVYQSFKNQDWINNAQVQAFRGSLLERFRGGSAVYADAIINGRMEPFWDEKRKGRGLFDSAEGRGASFLNRAGGIAENGLNAYIAGKTLQGGAGGGLSGAGDGTGNTLTREALARSGGGIASNVTNAGAGVAGLLSGDVQADEARALMTRIDTAVGGEPLRKMIFDTLAGTASTRLMASRRLGSRHMGIAGIGAGYGLSAPEAFGSGMGMAEQFGATTVNGGLFRNALQMETFGFNRDAAGTMLGQLGQRNDVQTARKELEEVFARGIKRGLNPDNVQFFEAIGQAVASNAFGPGGALGGGSAFGQAMMGGLSDPNSMHSIQSMIQGVSALNNVAGNGYFGASFMENAKRQLGTGADWASAQGLGQASWAELMQGSKEMSVLGITEEDRRNQMSSRISSMLGTAVGSGRSKIGGELLSAYNSSGSWREVLKNRSLREKAAALLRQEYKGAPGMEAFSSFDQANNALGFLAGTGDTPLSGGGKMQKQGDGNAIRQLQTNAQNEMKLYEKEIKISKEIGQAFDYMGQSFEKLASMPPSTFENARQTVEALEQVYNVLAKISEVAPKAAATIQQSVPKAQPGRFYSETGTVFIR